jgi:hypothetical protein
MSALADLGTFKCRSRVNPRSASSRNDDKEIYLPGSTSTFGVVGSVVFDTSVDGVSPIST